MKASDARDIGRHLVERHPGEVEHERVRADGDSIGPEDDDGLRDRVDDAPQGEHTTSPGSSDLALQVSGDSTYTLKWGNRRPSMGTVADRGTRVILDDESGARITLVRSGDTLYGALKDRVTGRQTMVTLDKQGSGTTQFAVTNPRCYTAGTRLEGDRGTSRRRPDRRPSS